MIKVTSKLNFAVLLVGFILLMGCGPSPEQQATMTAAQWTETPTNTLTPSVTPTASATPPPTPTLTPTPPGGGSGNALLTGGDQLLTLNVGTGEVTNLSEKFGFQIGSDAALSPDRSAVVFSSGIDRNGTLFQQVAKELYRVNIDGSNMTRLTNTRENETNPQWSPDGLKIAAGRFAQANDSVLVLDSDGKNLHDVIFAPNYGYAPFWSPDGQKIAFVSWQTNYTYKAHAMNSSGTQHRQFEQAMGKPWTANPWSLDGKYIAYSYVTTMKLFGPEKADVHLINVETGEEIALTDTLSPDNEEFVAWSPDGGLILYRNGANLNVIQPDGSGNRTIATGIYENYYAEVTALWSPDGQFVLVADSQSLYLIDVNTTEMGTDAKHNILSGGYRFVAWLP